VRIKICTAKADHFAIALMLYTWKHVAWLAPKAPGFMCPLHEDRMTRVEWFALLNLLVSVGSFVANGIQAAHQMGHLH
jgi:hypothetical protein